MNCKQIMEKLQDYYDGDLKEKYNQQIELHLKECTGCRAEYRLLKNIGELFRQESIRLPDENHWKETWKTIECQIIKPKTSWYREFLLVLDGFIMRYIAPRSLSLHMAFSSVLFILGIGIGGLFFHTTSEISQRVVRVEQHITEIPVIQEKEIVKYQDRIIPTIEIKERIIEKPKIIYLATANFEPAPIFPVFQELDVDNDTSDLWTPRHNVDRQIQEIQDALAPTFNNQFRESGEPVLE